MTFSIIKVLRNNKTNEQTPITLFQKTNGTFLNIRDVEEIKILVAKCDELEIPPCNVDRFLIALEFLRNENEDVCLRLLEACFFDIFSFMSKLCQWDWTVQNQFFIDDVFLPLFRISWNRRGPGELIFFLISRKSLSWTKRGAEDDFITVMQEEKLQVKFFQSWNDSALATESVEIPQTFVFDKYRIVLDRISSGEEKGVSQKFVKKYREQLLSLTTSNNLDEVQNDFNLAAQQTFHGETLICMIGEERLIRVVGHDEMGCMGSCGFRFKLGLRKNFLTHSLRSKKNSSVQSVHE